MIRKHSFILIILILVVSSSFAADNDRLLPGLYESNRPVLYVSPMFNGSVWNPRGLQPYDLSAYPRSYLGVELSLHHPLRVFHHKMDYLQIPSLSVESNFSAHESDGTMPVLEARHSSLPAIRTGIWVTALDFLSFRWQGEQYNVELSNPTEFFYAPSDGSSSEEVDSYLARAECTYRDIEIGLFGTPDGEDWDTVIEGGYFNMRWERPVVIPIGGTNSDPTLYLPEHEVRGFYLSLSADPIENQWPVHTKLAARLGRSSIRTSSYSDNYKFLDKEAIETSYLQFDLKLTFERPVTPWLELGGAASAQYRLMSYTYESDQDFGINESETRFGITIFSRFELSLPGTGIFD